MAREFTGGAGEPNKPPPPIVLAPRMGAESGFIELDAVMEEVHAQHVDYCERRSARVAARDRAQEAHHRPVPAHRQRPTASDPSCVDQRCLAGLVELST